MNKQSSNRTYILKTNIFLIPYLELRCFSQVNAILSKSDVSRESPLSFRQLRICSLVHRVNILNDGNL